MTSNQLRPRFQRVKVGITIALFVLFTLLGLLIMYALDATGEFTDVAGAGFVAGMMFTLGGFGLTLIGHSWYRGELNV